jgi:hypothetical protein
VSPQSYQNASRETLWYDFWGKALKDSCVALACDECVCAEDRNLGMVRLDQIRGGMVRNLRQSASWPYEPPDVDLVAIPGRGKEVQEARRGLVDVIR